MLSGVCCASARSCLRLVRDRNWLEFLAVLDAAFADVAGQEADEAQKAACVEAVAKARELFSQVAEEDGGKDRAGLLALLELEKRARAHGVSSSGSRHLLACARC